MAPDSPLMIHVPDLFGSGSGSFMTCYVPILDSSTLVLE